MVAALDKVDHHLLMAALTGFVDHSVATPGPFLFMLEVGASQDWAFVTQALPNDGSRVTNAHVSTGSRFATAQLTLNGLKKVLALPEVKWVEWGQPMAALRTVDRRGTQSVPSEPDQALPKSESPVLFGVVDHGCPFAHRALRSANGTGTRILSIWDQDPKPDFPSQLGAPDGFGFGRQALRRHLNGYMKASVSHGLVDEDACYRRAQYSPMRDALTHGSHTLGLLAGSWLKAGGKPANDLATRSDVVFVQLPRQVLQAPSHGGDHQCILDAVRYIVSCAGSATKDIVIVIDYGSYLGPHHGMSYIERALDALVQEQLVQGKTLLLVFPSGNGAEDKTHASGTVQAGSSADMDWIVPSSADAPLWAEVWLPKNAAPATVHITPPGASQPIGLKANSVCIDPAGSSFTALRLDRGRDEVILLRSGPTADGLAPAGQAGRYRVQITTGEHSLPVHFYTAWGGENLGFPKRLGQARWLSHATGVQVGASGSILGTASGAYTFVAAGVSYDAAGCPDDRARYSGAGPSRAGKPPFVSAMCEDSPMRHGVLGLGTRSGAVARMWGTSVAAPIAARALIQPGSVLKPLKKPGLTVNEVGQGAIEL
ncbi:MAG: hypothetical protein RLZZ126_1188 [Pseudomonadota bacterium]|jgi:hypothetical protein